MNKLLFCLTVLGMYTTTYSQVGIGTVSPDQSSVLEVESNNKGFLPPRLANNTDVSNPATGLLIYNESTNCLEVNVGTPSSPNWTCLSSSNSGGGSGSSSGFGIFPWKTSLRFDKAELMNSGSYYAISEDKNLFMGGHIESYSSIHEFNGDIAKSYDLKSPKFMDYSDFNGKVEKVEATHGSYAVLTTDKKVFMWGYQGGNQIGNGYTASGGSIFSLASHITTPEELPLPAGETEFLDIFKPTIQRIFFVCNSGKAYFRGNKILGLAPLDGIEFGQIAFPSTVDQSTFKYTKIVGGSSNSIYLEGNNGKYYAGALSLHSSLRSIGASSVPYSTTPPGYYKDIRLSTNIYEMEFPAGTGAISKMEGINGQGIYTALGVDGRAYAWGRLTYGTGSTGHYVVSSTALPTTGSPTSTQYQNTPILLDFPPGETSFKDISSDGATFRTFYLGGSGKVYMIKDISGAAAEFYVLENSAYGSSLYKEIPMPSSIKSMDTRVDNGVMVLTDDGEIFYLGNLISGYPNRNKYIGNGNGVQPYAHIATPLMHGQYDENNPNHIE